MSNYNRRGEKPHDGSTDNQSTDHTRRDFMAAGISAAALSLLPGGQPHDLEAWPTPDDLHPPAPDAGGGFRDVASFEPQALVTAEGPSTRVSIPEPPTSPNTDAEMGVQYDEDGIYLGYNIETEAGTYVGLLPQFSPAGAERLAAQLEAASSSVRQPTGELTPIAANHYTGAVKGSLLGLEMTEGVGEVRASARTYGDGVLADVVLDRGEITVHTEIAVLQDAPEVARALRIAAAEWRRWPATDS